jgi:methylated-DNA-protein-cysteine methyltransferase-like protein
MNSPSEPEEAEILELYAPVYDFVRTVPPGKVVTYGQVADCLTTISLTARQVGTAMRYAPPDVPWQRVVGAGGNLPIGKQSAAQQLLQRDLLLAEGTVFLESETIRVDMRQSQWQTEDPAGSLSLFDE